MFGFFGLNRLDWFAVGVFGAALLVFCFVIYRFTYEGRKLVENEFLNLMIAVGLFIIAFVIYKVITWLL